MRSTIDYAFPMWDSQGNGFNGMTIREYAAIHLMVPDSGNKELDDMITKAIQAKTGKAAFSAPDRPKVGNG